MSLLYYKIISKSSPHLIIFGFACQILPNNYIFSVNKGAKKAGFPGKYGDIDGGLSELLQYCDISRHDFSEPFSPAVIRCTVGGANRPTSIQGGMNHVVLLLLKSIPYSWLYVKKCLFTRGYACLSIYTFHFVVLLFILLLCEYP